MIRCALGWFAKLSPWLVIASLAYAAAFVKPNIDQDALPQPLLEPRDRLFGAAAEGEHIWFVGGDGLLLQSENGGEQWRRAILGNGPNLQSTAVGPDGTRIIVGNEARVFAAAPGTDIWTSYQLPLPDYANKLFEVRFIDGSFWVVGEMGSVYQLSPNGLSYTDRGLGEDLGINSISAGPDGTLWLAAEFGQLFRSGDGGRSWERFELAEESLRKVLFHDRVGVAVGNRGLLLVSRDGGATWDRQPSLGNEHLYDVIRHEGSWVVTGEQGQLLSAAEPDGKWKPVPAEGLSKTFFMRLVPLGDSLALAGQRIGVIKDGAWTSWPTEE